MISLMRRRLAMEQISTKLTDILKQRAIPALDVAPELAGRKPVLNDDRASTDQNRTGRLYATRRVIHGQAVIHAIRRLRVHHAGKPVAPLHETAVTDVGRLGQAGGSRGVNVERWIVDRGRPLFLPAQHFAAAPPDLMIHTGEASLVVTVAPDRRRYGKMREHCNQAIDQLSGHNDMFGRDYVDAASKRRARQMSIQQRNHTTNFGDA